ncbi:uncharacterized protein HGUI_02074 [Hanseniaspora guilliermondii]|uniref:Uncharacterized protein n=1 Tax=Hanseniaspora guilliermondii TaxID=56406 RepID=A0A1L0B0E5_9ASCO|nr:uncharacterized protein HGUI_02074 [Hanseniaspora guilliermondii]
MLKRYINHSRIKWFISKNKRYILITTLVSILILLIILLSYLKESSEYVVSLNDYIVNFDVDGDFEEKHLKDPYMLQLLNIYNREKIIDIKDKPSVANLFDENTSWLDALNQDDFINYEYPMKLPSVIYSNSVHNKQDNCIIFVISEVASVKKSINSVMSIINTMPKMSVYPVYFITGFYISDDDLMEIFEVFDPLKLDINIIKVTDIVVDNQMCGESIDYLFQGYSDIKCEEYRESRDLRMYNDFDNLYPSALFKDNKNTKWKQIKSNNKNSHFKRVFEEYGDASIDFIKLFSYDLYQFDVFKNFKNFMIMRPGMILKGSTENDLFNSYYSDNDYAARFVNFRFSHKYRNSSIQELLKLIYQHFNLSIDSIFYNNKDSMWKQMFNYALKNTKLYNRAKTRNFNVQNSMKGTNLKLFNGILLDTQDSIFISKFDYFRSREYELFYKNMFLAFSIYNDAMIPNDSMTLFLSLLKRPEHDGNEYYRKDFEIINDIELMYDVSGNGNFKELIHNNVGNVEHYMNINNLQFNFTLADVLSEEGLLPSRKRHLVENTNNSKVSKRDEDLELENSQEYLFDQRFFSTFSFEKKLNIFKNHEFIEMMKYQIFQKHKDDLSLEQIEQLLDLYIHDNIKKMYRMFKK